MGKALKMFVYVLDVYVYCFCVTLFYHNNEGYVLRRKHTKMTSK